MIKIHRGVVLISLVTSAAACGTEPEPAATGCTVPITHPTIGAAIADPTCDQIAVTSGTYAEHLRIGRDLTITGVGPDPVVIDGGASGRVITIATGRVALETMTIRNGRDADGGGIANHGALELRGMRVEGNTAIGEFAFGGGVFSDGPSLRLDHTAIVGNRADGERGAFGAGVYAKTGMIEVTGGSFERNEIRADPAKADFIALGAGLAVEQTNAVLGNVVVTGNTIDLDGRVTSARGAGVYAERHVALIATKISANAIAATGDDVTGQGAGVYAAELTTTGSEILNNTIDLVGASVTHASGGGIHVAGTGGPSSGAAIGSTKILGNRVSYDSAVEGAHGYGGGIAIEGTGASFSIEDSTIAGNRLAAVGLDIAANGAGLSWRPATFDVAMLAIRRSTVADNAATATFATGGGISLELADGGHAIRIEQTAINSNRLVASDKARGGGIAVESNTIEESNTVVLVDATATANSLSALVCAGVAIFVAGSTEMDGTLDPAPQLSGDSRRQTVLSN